MSQLCPQTLHQRIKEVIVIAIVLVLQIVDSQTSLSGLATEMHQAAEVWVIKRHVGSMISLALDAL